MGQNGRRPILSSLADDPALQDQIDAFVIHLGEGVDELQDAELQGDLKRLDDLAQRLDAEARRLGYAPLAAAAVALCDACTAGDGELARRRVEDLTEVSRRVRLGHRSAA